MSYLLQFAYPAPPSGVNEDQFSYSFDSSNTPGLVATIPAAVGAIAGTTLNIPLQLQTDAVFMVRAIRVSAANLGIKFRTTFGRILSDDFVQINLAYQPSSIPTIAAGLFIPFEPELLCTPGGIITVDFSNSTNAPIAPPKITMYGPKRYRL